MTKDEALKLALEALKQIDEAMPFPVAKLAIMEAEKALAQTQEPVAHWSDCAVHSEPAYPKGECDCGGFNTPPQTDEFKCPLCYDDIANIKNPSQPEQEPVAHLWECLGRWSAYLVNNGTQAECAPPLWLVDAIKKATTPPQRKPLPPQSPCEMTKAEGKMFKLGWLECEAAHGIKGDA